MSRGDAETREGCAGDGDVGQRRLALSRAATATAPGARARLHAAPRFREEKSERNASATADLGARADSVLSVVENKREQACPQTESVVFKKLG